MQDICRRKKEREKATVEVLDHVVYSLGVMLPLGSMLAKGHRTLEACSTAFIAAPT